MAQSKLSMDRTQHQEEITLTWTIPKFQDAYAAAKTNSIRRCIPVIAEDNFIIGVGGKSWRVFLKPSNEEDVGLFLHLIGLGCASAEYTVAVKSPPEGEFIHALTADLREYESANPVKPDGGTFGWRNWKTLSELQQFGYLPNDELSLQLKVKVYHTPTEVNMKRALSKDLSTALVYGTGSDITFIFTEEGSEEVIAQIKAHKTILSLRSPVFRDMFASGRKDVKEGKIKISDMWHCTMRILLRFIYTGEVDGSEWVEFVDELIYAADKYQLEEFKNFLCENIASAITPQNAMEIRNLGARYNLPRVVEAGMKFMKDNFEQFFELHDIVLKGTFTSTR